MKKCIPTLGLSLVCCTLLSMCGDSNDGAIPAGALVAVDPVADSLMAQAQGYYNAGIYKQARILFRQVAADHRTAPCAPQARFMAANCYLNEEEYRDAFKQYQRVITDYPHSALYEKAINAQLEMAHHAVDGDIKGEVFWGAWHVELDSSVVIEWLRTIIKNAPYNEMAASTTAVLGKYLMSKGKYDEACAVYTKLVETYPTSKLAPSSQLMVANLWALRQTKGDQNLANLSKAEEAYEEYYLRFPEGSEAKKALSQANSMRKLMVEQELDVAKYYYERANQYNAALFTLKQVASKSDINPEAAAEAKALIPEVEAMSKKAQTKPFWKIL